ncbi:CHASE2 domain-containing protein [Spirulina subsalsa FACHB-351]|uniref:non-specific serine/threonine protein kinase n=1 Tax=Spirulina subsalsa FACHB-351 TaxID=234711 RepID=A0ABT3L2B6_9CYAN|nr:serine/threonine-protein kinase [Spirulina subsalsa]MCW6035641.1 CHASE2 domain-containing protein [Spirulina subsalsa FACHB-351]
MAIPSQWQFWRKKPSSPKPRDLSSGSRSKTDNSALVGKRIYWKRASVGMMVFWALCGAIATTQNNATVQWLDNQLRTLWFHLHPPSGVPEKIVIIAIDDYSIAQGTDYAKNPDLTYLEPIQRWPWERQVYAQVIEKVLDSGAKVIAFDLLFDLPSGYGEADDQALEQALRDYGPRVVLAASYEQSNVRRGEMLRLISPQFAESVPNLNLGFINYLYENDGRIHRLGRVFQESWLALNPDLRELFQEFMGVMPSFAQATVQGADLPQIEGPGEGIFFRGPRYSFEYIPFVDLLDPDNWHSYLGSGAYFQDKIVLVGVTSELAQDFHRTAVDERMPGIEIHANAIATLLTGQALREAFPQPLTKGAVVLISTLLLGVWISQRKYWFHSLLWAVGFMVLWSGGSYLLCFYAQILIPTAVPLTLLTLTGISTATLGVVREFLIKQNLRTTLKHYASSPIIQEIIAQQDDFHDLLAEREREVLATKLVGRYQVLKKLSAGGFGETYIALDTLRPGKPQCVVKQLHPTTNDLRYWQLAKRLFVKEAETLERLGKHDQIPQLLAYFEEGDEFYLVQELIEGHPLGQEFSRDVPFSEVEVIDLLRDLLEVLLFIHEQGVIHRDIKPDNIIRRQSDHKLVLIDFGTVKEMQMQWQDDPEHQTNLTIAIGTKGYTPKEQAVGRPRFSSDIYATGMIALRALTLLHPTQLEEDPRTGELLWEHFSFGISPELSTILNKMIRSHVRDRYQNAKDVLCDLQPLIQRYQYQLAHLPHRSQTYTPTAPESVPSTAFMPTSDADTQTVADEEGVTAIDPVEATTQPLPNEEITAIDPVEATTQPLPNEEITAIDPTQDDSERRFSKQADSHAPDAKTAPLPQENVNPHLSRKQQEHTALTPLEDVTRPLGDEP